MRFYRVTKIKSYGIWTQCHYEDLVPIRIFLHKSKELVGHATHLHRLSPAFHVPRFGIFFCVWVVLYVPPLRLLQNFKTIKRIKNIQNNLFWSFVNKNSKWDKKFSRLLGVKIALLRHQWIHSDLQEKYNFQFQVLFV